MNACIAMALRIGHGENTITKASMPSHGTRFTFQAAHPQMAHSVGMSAGLTSAATAQATPAGTNFHRATYSVVAAAKNAATNRVETVASPIFTGITTIDG